MASRTGSGILGAPSREVFVQQAQRQERWLAVAAGLIAVAAVSLYLFTQPTSLTLPLLFLFAIFLPPLFWHAPRTALYAIYAGVCLFEIFPNIALKGQGLTDMVPLFWNINTIFQRYLGTNPKAAPFNAIEVICAVAAAVILLRLAVRRQLRVKVGGLFLPILVYLLFVGIGWFIGMSSGGNFTESLQEVRAQFYFGIAYVLAVNAIRNYRQIDGLLWTTALCVAFKALCYLWRHFIFYSGKIQDQGVGSHEEAFFFMVFVVQLGVLAITGLQKRLQIFMALCLPMVFLANLTTNRRAAYAALMIAMILFWLASYKAYPKLRRRLLGLVAVALALGVPYFVAFRNKDGGFAAPARAIQSAIAPNKRDESSNLYRKIENYDLLFTLRNGGPGSFYLGYGYGKRFLTPWKPADISAVYEYWNLLPHNQILWVWMRIGTVGFLAFWAMVCSILVYAARVIRWPQAEPHQRLVALLTLLTLAMLLLFGLLDLQLSCYRDMLFVGIWVGALVALAPDAFRWNDPLPRKQRLGRRPDTARRPRR